MSRNGEDDSRNLSPGHRLKRVRSSENDEDTTDRVHYRSEQVRRRRSRSRDDHRSRKRRSVTPQDRRDGHRRNHRRPRHDRSASPQSANDDNRDRRHHRRRRHSRSRSRSPRRPNHDRSASPPRSKALARRGPLPSQDAAFTKELNPTAPPPAEKEKPNFKTTGRLAAASNTVQTAGRNIVLKYHEPSEARKPPASQQWRMYVFKNGDIVETVPLSEQSVWLCGREAAVADVYLEHPSASGQHAVLQFRYIEKRDEFGDKKGRVKLYVLDLESEHGTRVNAEKIPTSRYVEVRDGDVVKFGESRREYVLQLAKE